MPDGKLKCSSRWSGCAESSPVPDALSCISFCSSSDYFTWKSAKKECFCKHSDSGRKQQGGSVSGRTNCQGKVFMIRWSQADNNYKLFLNAECVTKSGAKSGQACIFPFIFNGVVYNGCTLDNAGDNKAWCSVGTDADGVHVHSDWGHCPSSCKMHDGAYMWAIWKENLDLICSMSSKYHTFYRVRYKWGLLFYRGFKCWQQWQSR